MVCLGRRGIPSPFVGRTTHSRTGHGMPSVEQHIQPEERRPQRRPVPRDRPTAAKRPSKLVPRLYALAPERYNNATSLYLEWRGEATSGILSPRNVKTAQSVRHRCRQWRLNWSMMREERVLDPPNANLDSASGSL